MKIVIAGNYGAKNFGDELILKGLLKTMKECFADATFTVLSGDIVETQNIHGVDCAEKFPAGIRSFLKNIFCKKSDAFKKVKECDYFVLGGGGLFGGPKTRADFIWGRQALMAYKYGKKVVMLGQSIGMIKNPPSKFLVKKLFEKATLISVRDESSKKRLQELGIKKDIGVYPDFAFFSESESESVHKKDQILVSLREMNSLPKNFENNIAEFLNWLAKEKNWQVVLADFQKGVESDEHLRKKITEKIIDKSKIEIINDHDLKKIITKYKESKMVLGMRLHSLILAIKTNTPFIALNYAPKVKDLLAFSGFKELAINLDEATFENLKEQFSKTLSQENELISKFETHNKKTQKEYEKFKTFIKNALK
ncbi:MAG: polysaccharide pyruvyl transferase family protein [Candidatus Gracilibacteria bacterium]|nr:polysaccharide pyruvyl transferase family protein [Candidatus Gracilibacteria bacterium]